MRTATPFVIFRVKSVPSSVLSICEYLNSELLNKAKAPVHHNPGASTQYNTRQLAEVDLSISPRSIFVALLRTQVVAARSGQASRKEKENNRRRRRRQCCALNVNTAAFFQTHREVLFTSTPLPPRLRLHCLTCRIQSRRGLSLVGSFQRRFVLLLGCPAAGV